VSFRNPIVAGNVLVRNAIQSPNYLPGSAGWIIRRDGSAEFSNAIFRGSVDISGSNNLLMYTSTPAAGDLVIALAPNAGADTFGNAYPQGLSIMNGAQSLALGLTGGSPLIYGVTGNNNITNSGAVQATIVGTGNAEYDLWQVLGPQDATQKDFVAVQLASSSEDGSQAAHLALIYVDSTGTAHPYLTLGSAFLTATTQLAILRATNSAAVNATYSIANATNAAYAYNSFDSTGRFLSAQVTGDTISRFISDVNGTLGWGSGTASRDVALGRSAAGVLSVTTGAFSVTTAGQGLRVKEGSNAKQGTAVLTAGTATVANTSVTATSRILLTSQADGGAPGFVRVSSRAAGTSFTITSSSATDTSTIAYEIFEQG
jgi:hypothetical protein